MKIGIDARFYGKLGKGLGRYTQQLIIHLEKIDKENEYWIFLRRENFEEYQPKNNRFHKVLADVLWYGWKEQWKMPRILKKYHLDLVHFPHFNVPIFSRIPFVVTIHDLILLHHPTHEGSTLPRALYFFKFFVYKWVLRYALRNARHVFTVSAFTKQDILQSFPFVEKDTITVTHEANSSLKKEDESILRGFDGKKYGILKPYLLYVGNAYPHKNIVRMIRAYLNLKRENSTFVLVGTQDIFYKKVKKMFSRAIEEGRIVFMTDISDETLHDLYMNAQTCVFVSLYEGFGLPPLEAMHYGIPVVSSSVTSMPEILGDAPIYCDPYNEKSIQNAIRRSLDDIELRQECIKRGKRQVEKYSWERLASETLSGYRMSKK